MWCSTKTQNGTSSGRTLKTTTWSSTVRTIWPRLFLSLYPSHFSTAGYNLGSKLLQPLFTGKNSGLQSTISINSALLKPCLRWYTKSTHLQVWSPMEKDKQSGRFESSWPCPAVEKQFNTQLLKETMNRSFHCWRVWERGVYRWTTLCWFDWYHSHQLRKIMFRQVVMTWVTVKTLFQVSRSAAVDFHRYCCSIDTFYSTLMVGVGRWTRTSFLNCGLRLWQNFFGWFWVSKILCYYYCIWQCGTWFSDNLFLHNVLQSI